MLCHVRATSNERPCISLKTDEQRNRRPTRTFDESPLAPKFTPSDVSQADVILDNVKHPRHAVSVTPGAQDAGPAAVWRRVFRALFVTDLAVICAAAVVIIHDLVVGRAVGASRWAAIILVVIGIGQLGLWFGYGGRFHPGRKGRPRRVHRTISPPFPTTPAGVACAVLLSLVIVGGFVQAYLAFRSPIVRFGGPSGPTPSCRWPLDNHGTVTCVSHAAYISAVTEVQRFVLGVAMPFYGFFVMLMADAQSPQ